MKKRFSGIQFVLVVLLVLGLSSLVFAGEIQQKLTEESTIEQALKRGYASSIALPLIEGGRAFGALTIYSRDPDPFSDDEIKLLTELAGDLSYGIMSIRARLAREQSEKEIARLNQDLQHRVEELETIFDTAPIGLALGVYGGGYLYASPSRFIRV